VALGVGVDTGVVGVSTPVVDATVVTAVVVLLTVTTGVEVVAMAVSTAVVELAYTVVQKVVTGTDTFVKKLAMLKLHDHMIKRAKASLFNVGKTTRDVHL
jgi:hypothetical protein